MSQPDCNRDSLVCPAITWAEKEIERLRRRVEALEHLVVEECDPHTMADIPNAMLAQTARDAVARRATEAFSDEQSPREKT